ncbi:MAG: adenosylcobalamin-dependent ribonucleoside-diphosphate reductase [Candidatus Hodarchaeota archaeon]
MELSKLARALLEERYLLRNADGEVIETPEMMFGRVSRHVSQGGDHELDEEKILHMLTNLEFLPNSPTLMNAGSELGQLSACFVLPVKDSIEGIFDAVKNMAIIHKSGGGTGFSFSELRPKGDLIKSTMGQSSGPISFMNVFDTTTAAITQGGRRRGANMGILDVDHPDIESFIDLKCNGGVLENFNLSVAVTDKFMRMVKENRDFPLINPRTKKIVKKIPAGEIFDKISKAAWACGDPGLIFIDEINRANPTPELGLIKSTNPCGEIPLYSFESCNLGSINLAKVIKGGNIDWEKLKNLVITGVEFLDNVIDANKYPLHEIDVETKKNRKIGLGVMGFADMLILLGIKYNEPKTLEIAAKVMKFIQEEARNASIALGIERGSFPNFDKSIYKDKVEAMRNATRTAIAPTGTISLIASCSPSIEPIFSIYHVRKIFGIGDVEFFHPLLIQQLKEMGANLQEILDKIKRTSGIDPSVLPGDLPDLYVNALSITPEWHLKVQSTFQEHVDNSVSKTINLPEEATIEDVKNIFMRAHDLKCKGITIYRNKSKEEQVLNLRQ